MIHALVNTGCSTKNVHRIRIITTGYPEDQLFDSQ